MNACPFCGSVLPAASYPPPAACPSCGRSLEGVRFFSQAAPAAQVAPPAPPIYPPYAVPFPYPYGYPPPYAYAPPPAAPLNVPAALGLAFGIAGAVFFALGLYNVFLLAAVTLAVIGCVIALRKGRSRGLAIAGAAVTAAAVALTTLMAVFQLLPEREWFAAPAATAAEVDMAARGVAALQAHKGADAVRIRHVTLVRGEAGSHIRIDALLTQGEGAAYRYYAVWDWESMQTLGATEGWWDDARQVALYDCTLPLYAYEGEVLDLGEVLAQAAGYGYLAE